MPTPADPASLDDVFQIGWSFKEVEGPTGKGAVKLQSHGVRSSSKTSAGSSASTAVGPLGARAGSKTSMGSASASASASMSVSASLAPSKETSKELGYNDADAAAAMADDVLDEAEAAIVSM